MLYSSNTYYLKKVIVVISIFIFFSKLLNAQEGSMEINVVNAEVEIYFSEQFQYYRKNQKRKPIPINRKGVARNYKRLSGDVSSTKAYRWKDRI